MFQNRYIMFLARCHSDVWTRHWYGKVEMLLGVMLTVHCKHPLLESDV